MPIGANGWDTMLALNPDEISTFVIPWPSGATKSERLDALLELARALALCEVECGFRGI